MADDVRTADSFGPNEWLVEEMYDRFEADPSSVSPSWQQFFANYRRSTAPPRSAAAQAPPRTADGNGSFTVWNQRNKFEKIYKAAGK